MSVAQSLSLQNLSPFPLRAPSELFSSELARIDASISEVGIETLLDLDSTDSSSSPSRPSRSKRGRASITPTASAPEDFLCFPVLSSATQFFTLAWRKRFELIHFYLTGSLRKTTSFIPKQKEKDSLRAGLAAGTLVKITGVNSSETPPLFTIEVPSAFYKLGYAQIMDSASWPPAPNVTTFLSNASFLQARVALVKSSTLSEKNQPTSHAITFAFPAKLMHSPHFQRILEAYEKDPEAANTQLIHAFLDFFNCLKNEYDSMPDTLQSRQPPHKKTPKDSLSVQKIIKNGTIATCRKWEEEMPVVSATSANDHQQQNTSNNHHSEGIAMAILTSRFSPPSVGCSSSSSSSSAFADSEPPTFPTPVADDDHANALDLHTLPPPSESSSSTSFVKAPLSGWVTCADIIAKCLAGILPGTKPHFISESQWAAVTGEAKTDSLSKLTSIRMMTISEVSTICTLECSDLFFAVVKAQVLGQPVSDESSQRQVRFKYFGAESKLKGSVRRLTFKFPVELDSQAYFRRLVANNRFETNSVVNGTLRGALMTYYKSFTEEAASENNQTLDQCMLTAIENTRAVWKTTMTALEPAFPLMGL